VEILAMNLKPLPPKRLVLFAALFLALLVGACVALLVSQPWLGVRFAAETDGGLRIAAVNGPAREAGLAPGPVLALRDGAGKRVELRAGDIVEEPDFNHEYADYNTFLIRQGHIQGVLASGYVGIETPEGVTWIQPGNRPISDLPLIFWFQIVCGGIAWLVGAGVVANGSGRAARYYALTGAAFMLVTYTAAVYSARELALDAGLFRALSVADHAGAFLFAAAFLGLLWIYPARLGDARAPHVFLAAYLAVWIADTQQWVPNMNFGIRYPMLAGLGTSFVLAAMQWRQARHEPMSRAALKWFLMTLTVGSAVFVLGVFGMQAMGHLPVIPQGFAFGFVLMMYLGMAVGMRRYRLFNLEPWWPRLWLWFLGGSMVLVVDLLLLRALVLDTEIALILTVAIAGWLYFPLRQHVLRRTLRAHDARLSGLMPELIRAASAPLGHDALDVAWRLLLARAFRPITIHDGPAGGADARILDDGLRLAVPRIEGGGDLVLSHADDGRALFLATDRNLAQSLLELMRQAVSRKDSYARGVREERERIARDLHDDVGAKLLTLIHKTEASDTAEHLRAVLRDLRSLAASLEREPAPLGDALGDWRGEAADRCECAGVDLDWQDAVMDTRLPIHSGCRLAVERTLREAVTNALKHAQPSRLAILAEDTGDEIILSVTDDGLSPPPETWRGGLGLRNQRARMSALGGSMRYHAVAPAGSRVEIRLPKAALETP
jgi:signal transduction histidine kinase